MATRSKRQHRVLAKPPEQQPAQKSVVSQQTWTGPLPPPAALSQFDAIIPNGADRIMALVESEHRHRVEHESAIVKATIQDTRRGHYIGGAISLAAIVAAVVSVGMGAHPSVSIACVSLPVAIIIQAIVSSKSNK